MNVTPIRKATSTRNTMMAKLERTADRQQQDDLLTVLTPATANSDDNSDNSDHSSNPSSRKLLFGNKHKKKNKKSSRRFSTNSNNNSNNNKTSGKDKIKQSMTNQLNRVQELVAQIEAKERVIDTQQDTIAVLQQHVKETDEYWQAQEWTWQQILDNRLESIQRLTDACNHYEQRLQEQQQQPALEQQVASLQQELKDTKQQHALESAQWKQQLEQQQQQYEPTPKHVWFQEIEAGHKKPRRSTSSSNNSGTKVEQMQVLQDRLQTLLVQRRALHQEPQD